jgi:hypothetical protein
MSLSCQDGDRAAWHHAIAHLRIQAHNTTPDQVTLIRITDIEPYLTGRRSYLRAARGGT